MDPREYRQESLSRGWGNRGGQQAYGDPRQILRDRLQRQQGGMDPHGQRDMEHQDGMRGGHGGGSRRREQPLGWVHDMDPRDRERIMLRQQQQMLQEHNMMGGHARARDGFGTSGGMDPREHELRRQREMRREREQSGGGRWGGYNGGYTGGDDMSRAELMRQRQQQMSGGRPQRSFRDPREAGPSWVSREELVRQQQQRMMSGGGPQRFRDPRAGGPSWNMGSDSDGYGRRR